MVGLATIPATITDPHRPGPRVPAFSKHQKLRLFTEWRAAEVVTVASAAGDVDAANADGFLDYVLRKALLGRGLVVDLTGVTFFSTAGHAALLTLDMRCATAGMKWVMVPSRPVNHVIRICEGALPTADTVQDALELVSD